MRRRRADRATHRRHQRALPNAHVFVPFFSRQGKTMLCLPAGAPLRNRPLQRYASNDASYPPSKSSTLPPAGFAAPPPPLTQYAIRGVQQQQRTTIKTVVSVAVVHIQDVGEASSWRSGRLDEETRNRTQFGEYHSLFECTLPWHRRRQARRRDRADSCRLRNTQHPMNINATITNDETGTRSGRCGDRAIGTRRLVALALLFCQRCDTPKQSATFCVELTM